MEIIEQLLIYVTTFLTKPVVVGVITVLAGLAAFFGIPLSIIKLIRDRQKARHARELETYQLHQSKYSDFLKLCLDNPELPLHEYGSEIHEDKRKLICYEIFVSMCESAFFHYTQNHDSAFIKRQWTGWHKYIVAWIKDDDFRACWDKYFCKQFDVEFIKYVNQLKEEHLNTLKNKVDKNE
jgi:hypothetical protein